MLLFVGGLSGAGKSELGRHLQDHRAFIWFELDGEKDMVDELKIRDEWEEFRKGNPVPLSKRYPGNVVLTVASFPIIKPPTYLNCDQVRVRCLFGPKKQCIERAKKRSSTSKRRTLESK